ncbi:hypothetical protein AAF712_009357 [Marasmius tenuissimus]|uniref:SHSP domain-containing protein n=1 Tax=Marasmius tenuissimus TaxID=585030 RepID=A0ABR2ZQY1_9AGAR
MSYPYQYQDDYSTPSTPQFPQWEVIEQQHQAQDPAQQQQMDAGELLNPTAHAHQGNTPQQLYHPANVEASDHFAPTQPSPVEAPPALLHRHSHSEVPEASTSTAFARHRTSTHPITSQAPMGRIPLRRSPGARPRARANPYPQRPQSAGHIATTSGPTSARLHRVGEVDPSGSVFAPPPISTSVSSSSEGPSTAPPAVPGRVVSFGSNLSGTSPYNPTPMLPPTASNFTAAGGQQIPRQRHHTTTQDLALRPKRYIIRSDIQYDPRTQVLTASMELPGLNKSQLNITLSTCLINRIKQVVVLAHASPIFPPSSVLTSGGAAAGSSMVGGSMDGSRAIVSSGDAGGGNEEPPQHYHVRERRYGEFSRTFVVPAETKPEDIDAAMENGVLTLKISCGQPAQSADVQDIPIR